MYQDAALVERDAQIARVADTNVAIRPHGNVDIASGSELSAGKDSDATSHAATEGLVGAFGPTSLPGKGRFLTRDTDHNRVGAKSDVDKLSLSGISTAQGSVMDDAK